jgi:hypothetical protein
MPVAAISTSQSIFFYRFPFPGEDIALHELEHANLHTVTAGADDHAQGRGSLAFSIPGENDHKAYSFLWQESGDWDLRIQSGQFSLLMRHHFCPPFRISDMRSTLGTIVSNIQCPFLAIRHPLIRYAHAGMK